MYDFALKTFKLISFILFIIVMALYILQTLKKFSPSKEFFSELGDVSTAITAFGSLILLYFTYRSYIEAKNQRESMEMPAVSLKIVPDNSSANMLNFIIRNTGGGPAYDLNIKVTPDLSYGNTTINNLKMFKRMPYIEKGESIEFFFASAASYFDTDKPKEVTVNLVYYSLPRNLKSAKQITRNYELSIDERKGQRQIVQRDMNNLVKEIEKLRHAIVISNQERNE